MYENIRKYYLEYVLPSYLEYIEYWKKNEYGQNQLLRKSVVVSSALYHMREHLPKEIKHNLIEQECLDYGLLGDIVNASKHKQLNKNKPQITDANQIYELMVCVKYNDSEGEYFFNQLDVFVKLNNDEEICLTKLIISVMSFWIKKLHDLDIGDFKQLEAVTYERNISRKEAKEHSVPISLIQGEEYKLQYKFVKYNYKTGLVEPIDMTGAKMVFRVYKLPKTITIQMINSKGIEFDYDVSLTDEQAKDYINLGTNKEKSDFISRVISDNPEILIDISRVINN